MGKLAGLTTLRNSPCWPQAGHCSRNHGLLARIAAPMCGETAAGVRGVVAVLSLFAALRITLVHFS
jgi:hypothetical protein